MADKGGRPRKPDDDLAVIVRLPRGVIDKVDAYARQQIFARGEVPTSRSIGVIRRATISDLVDRHLSFDALHPTKVRVIAPRLSIGEIRSLEDGQAAWDEANKWVEREEERLTAEAPDMVQGALQLHELLHRRRSSS